MMRLVKDDVLYYFEHLGHGISYESPKQISDNPLILWCVGQIANEDSNDPYFAVISCGTKNRQQKPKIYEYIVKSCIIKRIPIYQVED